MKTLSNITNFRIERNVQNNETYLCFDCIDDFSVAKKVYYVAKFLDYYVEDVQQNAFELECYVLLKPSLSNNTCHAIVELALDELNRKTQ